MARSRRKIRRYTSSATTWYVPDLACWDFSIREQYQAPPNGTPIHGDFDAGQVLLASDSIVLLDLGL